MSFFNGSTALLGLGFLITEVSSSHSDIPHSVGLLWTSDRPVAETSTWQHTTLARDRRPCPRRDSNPQSQQAKAADLRHRPRGHWEWRDRCPTVLVFDSEITGTQGLSHILTQTSHNFYTEVWWEPCNSSVTVSLRRIMYWSLIILFFLNIGHRRWNTCAVHKIFSSLNEISHDQLCFLLFILRLLGYRFRPNAATFRFHKKVKHTIYGDRRTRKKLSPTGAEWSC
jgi:hypothetical protein